MNPIAINYTYVFQLVSFLIVVWILVKFAWKPLIAMMEKRRQGIADEIAHAEKERLEAGKLHAERQAELRETQQNARAMIDKAVKDGELRAADVLAQAREEAEKIRVKALQQIDMEKERAIVEIRAQVADLSIAVAEKILRQNLDLGSQKALIDQFIQEAGDRT